MIAIDFGKYVNQQPMASGGNGQLVACRDGNLGRDVCIKRLAPNLVNFYFQNVSLDSNGTHTFKTRTSGPVPLSFVALDDPRGIDVRPLIQALEDNGYDGWISVHQPLREGQTVATAIEESARVFAPLVA